MPEMEQLCITIQNIDINNADKQSIIVSTFNNILQEPAEEQSISKDVAECLTNLLQKETTDEIKLLTMQFTAEACKQDGNRGIFVETGMLTVLMNMLDKCEDKILVQCLRAIGNITMENPSAQQAILDGGLLGNVLAKIDYLSKVPFELTEVLPRVAFGCMSNIAYENESVQAALIKGGAIPILTSSIVKFHKKDPKLGVMAINALSSFTEFESGENENELSGEAVISDLCSVLKDSQCEEVINSILELLCDNSKSEQMKVSMCKTGCVDVLMTMISQYSNSDKTLILKQAADLVVLLSSGDSTFDMLGTANESLLNQFIDWMNTTNKQLQISGALALGNFARSEEACLSLSSANVHVSLIDALKRFMKDEDDVEQVHAICSCLKNMSIPSSTKTMLIDAGLADLMVVLVKTSIAPVQYKGLAILRLLVNQQDALASSLCDDIELLTKISELAAKNDIAGLCAESTRLTAAIIKNCQSSAVSMRNIAENGGSASLAYLLQSDHLVMQNEALVALVILASSYQDCLESLDESGVVSGICKLCLDETTQPQVIFNSMSFFQSLMATDIGKGILRKHDIKGLVTKLCDNTSESVRSRCKDTLNSLEDMT